MTKQEAIEKAWIETGIDFEKIKPMLKVNEDLVYDFKENGWIDFSPEVKKIDGYNPESLNIIGLRAARPKRLNGIDNNNGWIKIDGETRFPTSFINCWVLCNNLVPMLAYFNMNNNLFYRIGAINESLPVTHFQEIIEPKEPFY
jgi:hypothetical protein